MDLLTESMHAHGHPYCIQLPYCYNTYVYVYVCIRIVLRKAMFVNELLLYIGCPVYRMSTIGCIHIIQ